MLAMSIKVAPRLKKPSNPAVSKESRVSRRRMVVLLMGGVQWILPIINGYANERISGMQLFEKIRNTNAAGPKADVALTGRMIREVISMSRRVRKVGDTAVNKAPAIEPRTKAPRVAPNAISTSFMGGTSDFMKVRPEVR